MLTVTLYGHLADRYGKTHHIDAKTPAEVIRAFCANFKDFKSQIIQDGQAFYKVLAGKENRSTGDKLHVGTSKEIKIVPIIGGKSGLGRIIVGAALIAAAVYYPPLARTTLFGTTTLASVATSIGFSLVLGGISSMLFTPAKSKINNGERPENLPSYAFAGAINTSGQGNPVPICYGRLRVGSQVISTGLSVSQL